MLSGALLGRSEALLGCHGALFGRSGALLGCFSELPMGCSGGAVWVDFWSYVGTNLIYKIDAISCEVYGLVF